MHPPKPILLYYTYSAELTGGPSHVLNFVRHLDPELFRPLFVSHREGPLTAALQSLDVETIIVPYAPLLDVYRQGVLSYPFGKQIRAVRALLEYNRQIEAIGRHYQVQAVWARNLRSVLSTGFAARRLQVPLIWDSGLERQPRRLMRIMNWLGLYLATKVVSEASCQPRDIFGPTLSRILAHKLKTIHYGIPASRVALVNQPRNYQRPSSASFRLLNVATIHPRKNQLLLLHAVLELKARYPTLCVNFAGNVLDEDYFASLRQFVQTHGLSQCVSFLGWCDNIPALLHDTDLFVLCSDNEGVPHVLQEAMYAGLPVISTAVGGVPEIIHDQKTGFLIEPGDKHRLQQIIERCIEQPQLRRSVGTSAREFVSRNFTVERWMTEYQELLQKVCGTCGAANEPTGNSSHATRRQSLDWQLTDGSDAEKIRPTAA